eukprot:9887439-Karenia_brevis.AAC.1
MHHILWECDHHALVEARKATNTKQQHVIDGIDCVPLAMKYGLTPPLSLLPCSPWWTNDSEDIDRLDLTTSCKQCLGVDPSYTPADSL